MKKFLVAITLCLPVLLTACGGNEKDNTLELENTNTETVADDITELETESSSSDDIFSSIESAIDSRIGDVEHGFVDLPMSWNDLHFGHSHEYLEYGDSEDIYKFYMEPRSIVGDFNLDEQIDAIKENIENQSTENITLEKVTLDGVEGYKINGIHTSEGELYDYTLWVIDNDGYMYALELISREMDVETITTLIETSFGFDE